MDNPFLSDLDFDPKIPTVLIETEFFTGEAVEMYEMPSGMVMEMLSLPGPAQLTMMYQMLKLALMDPEDEERINGLSFNQLTEVLFQWYSQSPVRVGRNSLPRVTLRDILGPSEDEKRDRRRNAPRSEESSIDGIDDGPLED